MRTILEYLERNAARIPERTAVIDAQGQISYQDLKIRAEKIGSHLIRQGVIKTVGAAVPVPVLMEKGIPALASFYGICYAGGFYCLLNPQLPELRLKQILEKLGASVILTDEAHKEQAAALTDKAKIVLYEAAAEATVEKTCLQKVRELVIDQDPLYCNFTSGSTGTPKGVLINHRAVQDFIPVFTETFDITKVDLIANQAPFDFDVSVKDIYSALFTGATLLIVPRELFSKPVELLDYLCEYPVTVMTWAVSALCLITTLHGLDYKTPSTVKKILFSGESMPYRHLKQWMEHLPGTMFVNLYGPTEITCNCTYHILESGRDYSAELPIGKPFPNKRVMLLQEDTLITTPGEIGEVCVSGTCLGLGYYGDPEQTAAHFCRNPLQPYYPELIYRTGDLAFYNDRGELVFCGRKDFQIKYQGHRIELEEIEKAMMNFDGVERAICVFDEKKSRLFGFYEGTTTPEALEEKMRVDLADYMIPRKLIPIERMPITKNGKIDRKQLLEMAIASGRRRRNG